MLLVTDMLYVSSVGLFLAILHNRSVVTYESYQHVYLILSKKFGLNISASISTRVCTTTRICTFLPTDD
jgi:hypothetical protein